MTRPAVPEGQNVGRRNPPTHTRFQKGHSGNPGGRPRKERDLSKLVDAELDEAVTVTENGKPVKLTKRQLIAKGLVNDAAKGNLKALDAVIRLVSTAPRTQDTLVGVDPAILASFLARHVAAAQGEEGNSDPPS